MTNTQREEIIKNALDEYRDAVQTGKAEIIEHAINMMENVYIMVCLRNIKGAEKLRRAIISARAVE